MSNNIKKHLPTYRIFDGRWVVEIDNLLVPKRSFNKLLLPLTPIQMLMKGIRPPQSTSNLFVTEYTLPRGLAKWLKANCSNSYGFNPHLPYYSQKASIIFRIKDDAMFFKLSW